MTQQPKCFFNGCNSEARIGSIKCAKHRKKGICSGNDNTCRNQVYARGKCVLHGARNPCSHDGCKGYARSRGKCSRHGIPTQILKCSITECRNKPKSNGLCTKHLDDNQQHYYHDQKYDDTIKSTIYSKRCVPEQFTKDEQIFIPALLSLSTLPSPRQDIKPTTTPILPSFRSTFYFAIK